MCSFLELSTFSSLSKDLELCNTTIMDEVAESQNSPLPGIVDDLSCITKYQTHSFHLREFPDKLCEL